MAGKIKQMLDTIVSERSKGNPVVAMTTKTKIALKGIDTDKFTASSADDPRTMDKVRDIARELGIALK